VRGLGLFAGLFKSRSLAAALPVVLGNELWVQPAFNASTGVTLVNNSDVGGTLQITGGQLVWSSANNASDAHATALETLTAGTYRVVFTIVSRSGGNITPIIGGTSGTPRAAVGTFTEDIVITASNQVLMLRGILNAAEWDAVVDDFSVKRIN
jgi:hypothetical protein